MNDSLKRNERPLQFNQPNELTTFRPSSYRTWHLFVLMFSIACFISFTRLSWAVARNDYTSIEFILGTLGIIGFPIGLGMLNRGGFFTMVFSFAIAIGVAATTFNLSLAGF